MAEFRCKSCGGELEIVKGERTTRCKYCGTLQTIPLLIDERNENIYNRASELRRNNEYDKASALYEELLIDNPNDSDLYWSLVLCKYGVEYVDDALTGKKIPTINRAQYTAIFDDVNYKQAILNASDEVKEIYEAEATTINEIQKKYLDISLKEEPFDVFICYKETDDRQRRTKDSVIANGLYNDLVSQGYKVFFARVTLEDKLGVAYEPYIFQALNTAKVMVVIGTCKEYFEAVWVKNEWSRYLNLIKKDKTKVLIPAYLNMDPYDLPDEFKHLQAQDMGKIGFAKDLVKGINKLIKVDEGSGSVAGYMKRATYLIEDERYDDAKDVLNKALNVDPTNVNIYVGLLLVDYKVKKVDDLATLSTPLDDNINYQRIFKFAENDLKKQLVEINEIIKENLKKEEEVRALRRKKKVHRLILILLVLTALGGGGYASYKYYTNTPEYIYKMVDEKHLNIDRLYRNYSDETIYDLANMYLENNREAEARKALDTILYTKDAMQIRDNLVLEDLKELESKELYKEARSVVDLLRRPTGIDVKTLASEYDLKGADMLFNEGKYKEALITYISYKDQFDLKEKIALAEEAYVNQNYGQLMNDLENKVFEHIEKYYRNIKPYDSQDKIKNAFDLEIVNYISDNEKKIIEYDDYSLGSLINLVDELRINKLKEKNKELKLLYLENYPNGRQSYKYRRELGIKVDNNNNRPDNKPNYNNIRGSEFSFKGIKGKVVVSNDPKMENGFLSGGYVDKQGRKCLDLTKPVYFHMLITEHKLSNEAQNLQFRLVEDYSDRGYHYVLGSGSNIDWVDVVPYKDTWLESIYRDIVSGWRSASHYNSSGTLTLLVEYSVYDRSSNGDYVDRQREEKVMDVEIPYVFYDR